MSLGRVRQVVESDARGECVIYVMSRDQRVQDNHALLAAQERALADGLPLLVVFCLLTKTGYRAREHYEFMLEGLREVDHTLAGYDIPFMMLIGNPKERLSGLFHHVKPAALYFDFNPLRGPRALVNHFRKARVCDTYVVDTHNVVPVWDASDKREVGAYTLRPKIHRLFGEFLHEPSRVVPHPHPWPSAVQSIAALQPILTRVLSRIEPCGINIAWKSGEAAAYKHLESFSADCLHIYGDNRNKPVVDGVSDLSPYLHYGQISALRVTLEMQRIALADGHELHLLHSSKMPKYEGSATLIDSINALLEELVVRKELADNYCFYEPEYASLAAAPTWAQTSLGLHASDARKYTYTLAQLEQAQTHDPAWNAAQQQLRKTGKMHGYMRMYWAKKVLEWSPRQLEVGVDTYRQQQVSIDGALSSQPEGCLVFPEGQSDTPVVRRPELDNLFAANWAIKVLVYLNDHYSIDGGDPNGYAGILWSVAGVHDRAWTERSIFGKIRYMNYAGLKRKFDIHAYEQKWL